MYRIAFPLIATILCATILLPGCSSPKDQANDGVERCVPGRILECPCTGGETGMQTCDDDGEFGSCHCPGDEVPINDPTEEIDAGNQDTDNGDLDVSPAEDTGGADAITGDVEDDDVVQGEEDSGAEDVGDEDTGPDEEFDPLDQIPAFPGAQGWGATALADCRDLPVQVHLVETTDSDGPGSFRDIVENQTSHSTYDIVMFRTGGTISSEDQIFVRHACTYIAGQTAPGDGILIRSHPTNGHNGWLIRVMHRQDMVVRFLRLRHGEEQGEPGSDGGGGIGVTGSGGAEKIIFDHLSTTWGGRSQHIGISRSIDETPTTKRASIQNNLIAEGLWVRGVMFYTPKLEQTKYLYHMSFHRNLISTMSHRQPRALVGDAAESEEKGIEIVNNFMFNGHTRFAEIGGRAVVDFVKNYQDPGPHHSFSSGGFNRWGWVPASTAPLPEEGDVGSLYLEGNFHTDFDGPQWEMWVQRHDNSSLLPEIFQRDESIGRVPADPFPIDEMAAEEARDWILDNSGARWKLDCEGRWQDARDEVDTRIVNYIESGDPDQIPASLRGESVEVAHGGWPDMDPGTPCEDTNGDGIPDGWYERWGYDPADPPPIDTQTESGYLLIEHYLNNSDPDHPAPSLVVAPGIEP